MSQKRARQQSSLANNEGIYLGTLKISGALYWGQPSIKKIVNIQILKSDILFWIKLNLTENFYQSATAVVYFDQRLGALQTLVAIVIFSIFLQKICKRYNNLTIR